jgi:sulfate transport system permease protein
MPTKAVVVRFVALAYLAGLLVLPLAMVFATAFKDGPTAVLTAVSRPAAVSTLLLTIGSALLAVAANTVIGVWCALHLVRGRFPGKALLNALIDLPFAVSPVVVGLALLAIYGRAGWWGEWLIRNGLRGAYAAALVLALLSLATLVLMRRLAARPVEQAA